MARGRWLNGRSSHAAGRVRGLVVGAVLSAGLLGGCTGPPDVAAMLQSPDPIMRAKGCKLAGDTADGSVVPLLVDRLEDRDRAVRFYAAGALRAITGQDVPVRDGDPPDRRAEAIARWREYARRADGDSTDSPPTPPRPGGPR